MLKNERGWFMQEYELYPVLGIGHKLPAEGFTKEVQGVKFMCLPAEEPRYAERWGRTRKIKSSKHRLFYHCEACDRWIPFGRAAQHNKGRDHKQNKTGTWDLRKF